MQRRTLERVPTYQPLAAVSSVPLVRQSSVPYLAAAPDGTSQGEYDAQRLRQFWCDASRSLDSGCASYADAARAATRGLSARTDASDVDADRVKDDMTNFDTSEQRIQAMYKRWLKVANDEILRQSIASRPLTELPCVVLRDRLIKQGIHITAETLEKALREVGFNSLAGSQSVPLEVFTRLWQRLMLGVVCSTNALSTSQVRYIRYSPEHDQPAQTMSEQMFLFRTDWLTDDGTVHWVRFDEGNARMWVRLGLKAFLNPLATTDAMQTAQEGMTKIRRYRDQFIMCLEIYMLQEPETAKNSEAYSSVSSDEDDDSTSDGTCCRSSRSEIAEKKVCERVKRSVVLIVATGRKIEPAKGSEFSADPKSDPKISGRSRNRIITMTMKSNPNEKGDPLDRYETDNAAANAVFNKVQEQLNCEYGLREHDADLLLLSFLHTTAKLMIPVLVAYGVRLNELLERLKKEKFLIPTSVLEEVSVTRFEFEELAQWIRQMKAIIEHLSDWVDKADEGKDMHLAFGASEQNSDLRVYLDDTDDVVQQLADRLTVLGKIAESFIQTHQRYSDNRMNSILYYLTLFTFVFLPIQVMTGVYGMNFVDEDGKPGIPELTWGKYGYVYFWTTCLCLALVSLSIIFFGFKAFEVVSEAN